MHRSPLLLSLVVSISGACFSETVTDVHYGPSGELVVKKCSVDDHGRPTIFCHEEVSEPPPREAAPMPRTAEDEASEAPEAPVRPPAPRPAPTADLVAQALVRAGAPRLVALCRASYAPGLARVRFAIAIAPTGEIADIAITDQNADFAACAAHALHATHFGAFDGPAVRYDEELAIE